MKFLSSSLLAVLLTVTLFSCKDTDTDTQGDNNASAVPPPADINYALVKIYPHDTTSFTQGLFFNNGDLYESTGESGTSWVLKVNVEDGSTQKLAELPAPLFGEGSSIINDKLYYLTWMDKKVFVYDAKTHELLREHHWPYEGWGMTTDSTHLIVSTGSSQLYFVDPETFAVVKEITVNNNYGPVAMLNELEYVDGFIYANVYMSNDIVKIDPATGNVVGKLNMVGLLTADPAPLNGAEVDGNNLLNGIAYNPETKTFFVTGKRWSKLFEIKLN